MTVAINEVIKELQREKRDLYLQIEKARQKIALIDELLVQKQAALGEGEKINKKNVHRVIAEQRILEGLRQSETGLTPKQILRYLKSIGEEINESTLRGYIARMGAKKLIKKNQLKRWTVL